jgi:epoxyqueuosine reductase
MNLKASIQQLASEAGFLACGISAARKLQEEEGHLREWLDRNYQGKMGYMENYFDKRLDPTILVPGAKSVISFLYNYYPEKVQNTQAPKIAKYAYGEDYHRVIKDKLFALVSQLENIHGAFQYRIFVDSAPVMERQWAALSGLGWIGKNSLLLRQGVGSFFFIANMVCDLELEPDKPTTDHCGTCTACIDACPTNAIVADAVIDAGKCISYLTIESKEEIPVSFQPHMEQWAFGCDICQDVCPWNRFSTPNSEPRFHPKTDWLEWNWENWDKTTTEILETTFHDSAIQRAGAEKLRKNIDFLK